MSFCLKLNLLAACLGVCVLADTASAAGLAKQTVVNPRVRSVVRADAKGRLVRTVVVTPRVIQPRVVDAQAGAETADYSATVPQLVEAAAKKYDLDPLLVHSVIQVESGYNPYAVSPKGAQGLMQLMPGTARRFGVANSFDPRENIEGGVRYLKYLSGLFPHDPRLAIAAYNAGEGAVWKYNYQIPPYRETEEYVYKVARKYGQAKKDLERQTKAVETAVAVPKPVNPGEPVYAPVRFFVDADGRLHMQTAEPASEQSRTP